MPVTSSVEWKSLKSLEKRASTPEDYDYLFKLWRRLGVRGWLLRLPQIPRWETLSKCSYFYPECDWTYTESFFKAVRPPRESSLFGLPNRDGYFWVPDFKRESKCRDLPCRTAVELFKGIYRNSPKDPSGTVTLKADGESRILRIIIETDDFQMHHVIAQGPCDYILPIPEGLDYFDKPKPYFTPGPLTKKWFKAVEVWIRE